MTPTSFIVVWVDPVVGTRPLTKQVQYRVVGTITWIDNPVGVTQFELQEVGNPANGGTPLVPGTTYDVRVHVFNSAGENFSAVIPATTPSEQESPDRTTVPPATEILDANGHSWTIVGGQVRVDGTADVTTSNVVQLAYVDGAIWQQNSGLLWWFKTVPTDTWQPPSGTPQSPLVEPPPTGSPEVAQFNPGSARPGVGTGSNIITATVSSTVAAFCNKALFAVATQGFPNYNPASHFNEEMDAGDSAVLRAAYQNLGMRLVRMNNLHLVYNVYGGANINLATPNWSTVDKLISGFQATFPLAELMVCFGNQSVHNWIDPNVRQRFADAIRNIISRFEAGGLHIKYCQTVNEPNQLIDATTRWMENTELWDVEARVRAAVKPLFPNIEIVGPSTSWAEQSYIGGSGANCDSLAYNRYERDPSNQHGPALTDTQLYSNAVIQGADATSAQNWARAVKPGNYKVFKTEYFMDWYPLPNNPQYNPATGVGNDTRQQTFKGAIFCALCAASHAYGGLAGAQLWRLEYFDGSYGPYQKTAFPNLNATGSFLKAANQYLGGPCTPFTMTSTGTNKLLGMATNDGTNIGVLLVNYDASNVWNGALTNVTYNGTLNLPGRVSSANMTRWRLTSAIPFGTTDSVAMTGGNSLSISLPSESIMILFGAA